MRKRLIPLFLCLVLLAGCASQPAPADSVMAFTDHTGREIQAPLNPKKVAVLTSSLADLWLTAGGSVNITVGETVERGFVDETVVLVDDSAGKTINLELLIASEPDFVLYSSDLAGQLECAETLLDAGIPAAGFGVESFFDYLELLKICTGILGTEERWLTYGRDVKLRADELIETAQSQPEQPSVLFVRAGSSAKYTKAKTAENHFVCGMLQELGVLNIADAAPVLLDGLSIEEILLADPDAILFTTMGDEATGIAYMESLLADPVWQSLTAVQEGRVYQLPKEWFQYKPNSCWDEAYAYLIALLYGDIV